MSIAELYQHWDRAETAHEKFVAKRSRRPRLTAIEESQREALCIHAEQSREALARAAGRATTAAELVLLAKAVVRYPDQDLDLELALAVAVVPVLGGNKEIDKIRNWDGYKWATGLTVQNAVR